MTEADSGGLVSLPLEGLHTELGARLVAFAGYRMPLSYPQGIVREHLHTRARAGLFDVSHMGQIVFRGDGLRLESLLPADLVGLPIGQQTYSVLCSPNGGILDDLIVMRRGEREFLLVVNAACKHQDLDYLRKSLPDCDAELLKNRALLALQGPEARDVISALSPAAAELVFMSAREASIEGIDTLISCSGYTGEDGFEFSVDSSQSLRLARRLLDFDCVLPVGLGARDTLRLEAGLCLYGHDLNLDTTPVEAGLGWSIARVRRRDGARAGGFTGAEIILDQLENGTTRKRVGLKVKGRVPVREGTELELSGKRIGQVCSGGVGPSVGAPIAMAYVDAAAGQTGTELSAKVRGKLHKVDVVPMPFVAHRYFRG